MHVTILMKKCEASNYKAYVLINSLVEKHLTQNEMISISKLYMHNYSFSIKIVRTRKLLQGNANLPIERIPFVCFTSENSPMTVFSPSLRCSAFKGASLPLTTSATCATKPLSTYPRCLLSNDLSTSILGYKYQT